MAWQRPIPHPLLSARISHVLDSFREYGWPDARARYWLRTLSLLCVCPIRTPLHHLETWRVRDRVEAQQLAGPPVFIIGHWRSGTTHLQQLLSQDPQFGVVTLLQAAFPLDFLTTVAGPMVAALIPPNRTVDAVPLSIDSPWEEEMAMACFGRLSFFHAFFFPRQGRRIYRESVHFDGVGSDQVEAWWRDYDYFLKKVQYAQPGRRLLLKNPANTARVAALRVRFPGAKFIHIHRHPDNVHASTFLLHRTLQAGWALQDDDVGRLRTTVLENHSDLMAACFTETRGMQQDELIEVALADLETEPLGTLERIYEQLELSGFDAASGCFRAYLEQLDGFKKNDLSLNARERETVRVALGHVFERWSYS